jgi:outer membrane lipoprotein carrier protein
VTSDEWMIGKGVSAVGNRYRGVRIFPPHSSLVTLTSYLCLFSCLYTLASGVDARLSAVVDALQRRYASVRTIQGSFQQSYRAPGIEQSESGVFWMKKPGLMRWEYKTPEAKLFVADGRESYLYTPSERQVMVRRYSPSELHSTPLQFLLGQGDVMQSFTVTWETETRPKIQGTAAIRLTPKAAESDYAYLVLEVDEGNAEIRRILIRELTGNTSEFILTDLAANTRVDDRQFHFKVPRGVEIVNLDQR